ncbi:MAG: hypothetical protein BGO26_09645 [Actinobacteria bacterium 69-20]|jgi:hypothetical protein|nr:MAG: hypothetical protein BGO26_09645 [Actinobacteria bacterium 69-20]
MLIGWSLVVGAADPLGEPLPASAELGELDPLDTLDPASLLAELSFVPELGPGLVPELAAELQPAMATIAATAMITCATFLRFHTRNMRFPFFRTTFLAMCLTRGAMCP